MRYIYTWYCQDNDGVNDQSDIVWHTSSNRWQSIWCTNDIPFHNKWGYMVGYCHYMRYSITWIPRTYCVDSQFLQRRYKYQSMVRVEHRFWADPLSYLDYFMVNFNFRESINKVLSYVLLIYEKHFGCYTIYWIWIFLFFRHVIQVCQGREKLERNYPQSMVLNCLQAFSESAYQFLLQVTILMLTWISIGR